MQQLVEKYRPKTFDDIVGNPEIVEELRQMVKMKNIPHLLFAGNAGTGKTSLREVLILELYGADYKHRFKEINASDQNGIDIIRDEVNEYAKYSNAKDGIDFRILVLEECDMMSNKAQPALRRIMETGSKHCRFILTCNYIFKIILPIQNRCKRFEFKAIKPEEMIPRLKMICEKERINITDEALQYIAENSDGNMRKPLNDYLESCLVFVNKHPDKQITLGFVKKIQTTNIDNLQILKDALNNKFIQTRQFVLNQIKNGITVRNLITEVVESAYNFEKIPESMKGEIALLHAETEIQVISGVVDIIVITGFLAKLGKIGAKYLQKE